MTDFDIKLSERKKLLEYAVQRLEAYYNDTKSYPVSPVLNISEIIKSIKKIDFDNPTDQHEIVKNVVDNLEKYAVQVPHPKYFGLFNPRVNFASILSDLIIAVLNPQLAAWSHAPYAVEIENYLISEFGNKFGYAPDQIDGVFCTGGAEANLTAILCAINHRYPNFANEGVFGIDKRPIIYCSREAHHSLHKAARTVGLGYDSVRSIDVNAELQMDAEHLAAVIEEDIQLGNEPLMLIATAGTTGAGIIDDLHVLHKIASENKLWYHVDAAYGGGAILNQQLKPHLKGIELSDSITFDAHKWMSVAMATSIFLTSHFNILHKTFSIDADYMPKGAGELDIVDPFSHSIQWSRRFIGFKVYLSLMFFGWRGYEEVIDHQIKIGSYLKKKLMDHEWEIMNVTPFPVLCFTDLKAKKNRHFAQSIAQEIVQSGKSWISVYPINNMPCLRVCITNYKTTINDIDELIQELNLERKKYFKVPLNTDPNHEQIF